MVDTHCHLDSCKPPDAELVANARAAGINRLATVGMNDESIERALAAAHAHDEVYAIVGRHPNEATGFDPARDLEPIERAAADPRVRAIASATFGTVGGGATLGDLEQLFPRVEREPA